MASTYGIDFPFNRSLTGSFLNMTKTSESEVRANLVHLLLTRKGTRYFLPEFGTRLYEFIFEPNDEETQSSIRSEIQQAIDKYLPNLKLTQLKIERPLKNEFSVREEHAAVVRIDYIFTEGALTKTDFIEITI